MVHIGHYHFFILVLLFLDLRQAETVDSLLSTMTFCKKLYFQKHTLKFRDPVNIVCHGFALLIFILDAFCTILIGCHSLRALRLSTSDV